MISAENLHSNWGKETKSVYPVIMGRIFWGWKGNLDWDGIIGLHLCYGTEILMINPFLI